MGGDYRGGWHPMSQQQMVNMFGMPNYGQGNYGMQGRWPCEDYRNADPMTYIRYANELRRTPREVLTMYFGPVPDDKEALEKYLANVAYEVKSYDKRRETAENAMQSLNTRLKVAEKQKEALKRHYRLKSSWVYRWAVSGIFVTVGILGFFLAVLPAGPDYWPLKVMLITLCFMSGIGTTMLWKEYMDEE